MLVAFQTLLRKPALRAAYSSLTTAEAEFRMKNPSLGKIADSIVGYRRMIQESQYDETVGKSYLHLIKKANELAGLTDPQQRIFFENWVNEIEDKKLNSRLTP